MFLVLALAVAAGFGDAARAHAAAPTTTTITNAGQLAAPTVVGEPYAVQWSVTSGSPGTPTGTVTVFVDGVAACSDEVETGQCSIVPAETGTVEITARYGGDVYFQPSTSAPVTHTVDPASTSAGPTAFAAFALLPPWPSPARGTAFLAVDLPDAAEVTLEAYDTHGRLVGEILRHERLAAGRTVRGWTPGTLSAGVYVVRARAGSREVRRKLVWLGK